MLAVPQFWWASAKCCAMFSPGAQTSTMVSRIAFILSQVRGPPPGLLQGRLSTLQGGEVPLTSSRFTYGVQQSW